MKISFFTCWGTKCGIADYSCFFKNALERMGMTVNVVLASENKKLAHFIKLGKLMNNADIAHIQHEYSFFGRKVFQWSAILFFFLRQIKIPIVITLHELALPTEGRLYRLKRFLLFFIQRVLFSKAVLIFVHTEKQRKTLLQMGIKKEMVVFFPHPIPEIKERSNSNDKCKELFGVTAKNVFTIFGYVSQRKGYDLAINAIKDMEDSVLIIAGGKNQNDESGYFHDLTENINALKLRDRAIITGYIPENDIYKVMGATDIVLAPFLDMYGSGSLSLSVAYHKPIIASDIEPMLDLKKQGLGLELFKSGDSGDLKDKMFALIHNEAEKTKLINLTKKYSKDYSYTSSALKMIGFYKKVISG
jgi:glycosyltransferase involved in cell wall biosynthesis